MQDALQEQQEEMKRIKTSGTASSAENEELSWLRWAYDEKCAELEDARVQFEGALLAHQPETLEAAARAAPLPGGGFRQRSADSELSPSDWSLHEVEALQCSARGGSKDAVPKLRLPVVGQSPEARASEEPVVELASLTSMPATVASTASWTSQGSSDSVGQPAASWHGSAAHARAGALGGASTRMKRSSSAAGMAPKTRDAGTPTSGHASAGARRARSANAKASMAQGRVGLSRSREAGSTSPSMGRSSTAGQGPAAMERGGQARPPRAGAATPPRQPMPPGISGLHGLKHNG